MSPLTAVLAVLATMTAVVVATMVVENWRHLVQRVPSRPARAAARGRHPAAAGLVAAAATTAPDAATVPSDDSLGAPTPPEPSGPPAPRLPPHGAPEGALAVRDGAVVLRDGGSAEVLAALLFAAYAARRTSGADRASAWVTVAETPPDTDPQRYPPGVDLRGRPARVDELLSRDDGGRAWLTLQQSVDIARGVARTPVRQAALAGLVTWWSRSCAGPGVLDPDEVAAVRDAVAAVGPRLESTPWGPVVVALHGALRDAAAAGTGLLVDVALDATVDGAVGAVGRDGRDGRGSPVGTAGGTGSAGDVDGDSGAAQREQVG